MSFPTGTSYDQSGYLSNPSSHSSYIRPTPDFAINHRRMSDPDLPRGPFVYTPQAPSDCPPGHFYTAIHNAPAFIPSIGRPPSSHNPATPSSFYSSYSRAYNNTSSTDCLSQQGRDGASFNPSNNSSRPSTGSTGAVDSNAQVQSLSRRSLVSPDISTEDRGPPFLPVTSVSHSTPLKRLRPNEGKRLYPCPQPDCTKAFTTLNHLDKHIAKRKHGPERLPSGEHPLIFLPPRILTACYPGSGGDQMDGRLSTSRPLRKSRSLEVHDVTPFR